MCQNTKRFRLIAKALSCNYQSLQCLPVSVCVVQLNFKFFAYLYHVKARQVWRSKSESSDDLESLQILKLSCNSGSQTSLESNTPPPKKAKVKLEADSPKVSNAVGSKDLDLLKQMQEAPPGNWKPASKKGDKTKKKQKALRVGHGLLTYGMPCVLQTSTSHRTGVPNMTRLADIAIMCIQCGSYRFVNAFLDCSREMCFRDCMSAKAAQKSPPKKGPEAVQKSSPKQKPDKKTSSPAGKPHSPKSDVEIMFGS